METAHISMISAWLQRNFFDDAAPALSSFPPSPSPFPKLVSSFRNKCSKLSKYKMNCLRVKLIIARPNTKMKFYNMEYSIVPLSMALLVTVFTGPLAIYFSEHSDQIMASGTLAALVSCYLFQEMKNDERTHLQKTIQKMEVHIKDLQAKIQDLLEENRLLAEKNKKLTGFWLRH